MNIWTISLWICLAAFFVLVELTSPGLFYFLSCAFGACGAALGSFFQIPVAAQVVLFFMITGCALYLLTTVARNAMHKKGTKTNCTALIGKSGIVVSEISPYTFGYVKINGELWAASSVDQQFIPLATSVKIVSVKGVHLVVHPIERKDLS
ncbi:MAG TPA: NfeD family protein [Candidatus Bathyarchaeia archaeon]|nr:NfeD family protein [Candidatus Bathyarchaeia archaeon]